MPGFDRTFAHSLIGLIGGATLLLGGAGAAKAAVMTTTDTFDIGTVTTESSDNVNLPYFSSSLGTLTGATFTLTSNTQIDVTLAVSGGADGLFDVGEEIMDVDVQTKPGPSVFVKFGTDSGTSTVECDFSGSVCGASGTTSLSGSTGLVPFNGTDDIASGLLDELIGTGDFSVALDYDIFPTNSCLTSCGVTGDLKWSGTLSVAYTYTPAAVPEPASLALFGTGLLGVGFALRRRQRSV